MSNVIQAREGSNVGYYKYGSYIEHQIPLSYIIHPLQNAYHLQPKAKKARKEKRKMPEKPEKPSGRTVINGVEMMEVFFCKLMRSTTFEVLVRFQDTVLMSMARTPEAWVTLDKIKTVF